MKRKRYYLFLRYPTRPKAEIFLIERVSKKRIKIVKIVNQYTDTTQWLQGETIPWTASNSLGVMHEVKPYSKLLELLIER